ncbi:MAG TPA: hypothetical protein DCP28_07845, partial [Cytophagales bacterium]|nr:hypothetical protein [Cytophagales bacterium]
TLGQTPPTPSDAYQWHKAHSAKGVLILFPGFGHNAASTQSEFPIVEAANQAGFSVLLFNFNRHLWLNTEEQATLAELTHNLLAYEGQPMDKVFIGGYSSGGNVALLLSNYLLEQEHPIMPRGVFVVDSPIDLQQLYEHSALAVERNVAQVAVNEGQYLKQLFAQALGHPSQDLPNYQEASPYTHSSGTITNIAALNHTPLRLYTEPDLNWWQTERGVQDLSETNSGTLHQLERFLAEEDGWHQVEYVATSGKGYRADGTRHPHSWSIVDVPELLEWMDKIAE